MLGLRSKCKFKSMNRVQDVLVVRELHANGNLVVQSEKYGYMFTVVASDVVGIGEY